VAAEALRRWAGVEDASHVAALGQVQIVLADLPGAELGEYADNRITIDLDAGGQGWFVDPTPADDREFSGRGAVLDARGNSPAAGRMDLLSVLSHEMGHAMGLGHVDGGVMDAQLLPGQRTTPDGWWAAAAVPARGDDAWTQSHRATPARAEPVAIEWLVTQSPVSSRPMAASAAKAGGWQDRFVNQLGIASERANPNAALRLHLPTTSNKAPAVHSR